MGIKAINVGELDEIAEDLVKKGLAKMEEDMISINILDLGYNKIVGRGKVTRKLKVATMFISETAKKKIEALGGKIELIK